MLLYSHSSNALWILLIALVFENVRASHFRGGVIMVRPRPEGGDNEMEIFFHISWRRNSGDGGYCTNTTIADGNLIGGGSLTCRYGCSGTVSSMAYKCTDFSITENWSFGENQVHYNFSSEPVLTIGFTSCCWIGSVGDGNWNISSTFSMLPRNGTGVINSTPRVITSPVIRVQEGCNYTIAIPVTDPDNDIIKCRWAVGSECAGICNGIPGAVLDSDSCTIQYEAMANNITRYKAVALIIEDFTVGSLSPLSSVGLQFLVYVFSSNQSCSASPVIIPPTIRQGSCIAIPPDETFQTRIIADSLSSDVSISEIETVSPNGMIKGDVSQIEDSNMYYVNISWTPDAEQQDQTRFSCHTAINSDGLASDQVCIQFYPGIFPPKSINAIASPNQQLVHPSNTTWSISFDKNIQRPSVLAFITFFKMDTDEAVYTIDASSSVEVTYVQPNKLLITPNYFFTEKQEFYIELERGIVEGFEGCQPGNEPIQDKNFWTFITLDVTPPDIHFILQPSVSNANVYISWVSNEAVIWQCEIIHDHIEIDVNCSEGSWSGYDLSEGEYILQIEATDEAGNKAVVAYSFIVESTSPMTPVTATAVPTSQRSCVEVTSAFSTSQCSPIEGTSAGLSSSVYAGILVAITVPVTAVITSLLTVCVMYLCFLHKSKELKSHAEPYETPVSVKTTGFEMKSNTAYGQVKYTPATVYNTVNQ